MGPSSCVAGKRTPWALFILHGDDAGCNGHISVTPRHDEEVLTEYLRSRPSRGGPSFTVSAYSHGPSVEDKYLPIMSRVCASRRTFLISPLSAMPLYGTQTTRPSAVHVQLSPLPLQVAAVTGDITQPMNYPLGTSAAYVQQGVLHTIDEV